MPDAAWLLNKASTGPRSIERGEPAKILLYGPPGVALQRGRAQLSAESQGPLTES